MKINTLYCGDNLEILKTFPNESVDCCEFISAKRGRPIRCVFCPVHLLKERLRPKKET